MCIFIIHIREMKNNNKRFIYIFTRYVTQHINFPCISESFNTNTYYHFYYKIAFVYPLTRTPKSKSLLCIEKTVLNTALV